MRIFEIIDNDLQRSDKTVGHLLYFEKEGNFIIELIDTLDEWTAPLLLSGFVKKKIYTIPRDISFKWVCERIIPNERQNIGSILNNHRLKNYDEMKFLEISHGKCAQDGIMVRETDILPDYIKLRMKKNLTDVFPSGETSLMCFFADNSVKRVNLSLFDDPEVEKVINNPVLLYSCKLGVGGYYATFNDSIDIPAAGLYSFGKKLNVCRDDFISFLHQNVLDTPEACELLGCTRQNLSYMIGKDRMHAVKKDVMGNLFLKSEILQSTW